MDSEIELLIDQNLAAMHKLCRVYTFNAGEYEELLQEMLVQVWRSSENFRGEAKVSTWVYKICINTALNFRSRLARDRKRLVAMDGNVFKHAPPDLEADERVGLLYAAIRELKPIDRAIVSLHLDDRSYEEIGQILGISKTNVATRLMRLKRLLTEKLTK